jgi:hypothetical protein
MTRSLGLALCALSLVAVGCGNSASVTSGANEPIQVTNGQFFEGEFPAPSGGPNIDFPNAVRTSTVTAGFVGKKIGGLTPVPSLSVALALDGLSHGYWVVPVGSPDPLSDELGWSATLNFSSALPAGAQLLRIAAADRGGNFGKPQEQPLQILSLRPTGHVVASLTWGNDSDLDLHIVAPSGKELDPKHPNTGELIDAGADAGKPEPGSGTLDRDSNGDCVIDSYRNENVVWDDDAGPPEPGTYLVRVDMFSACGQPSSVFVFDLYIDGVAQPDQHKVGRLLATDADGGGPGSGLYVTEFTL